MKVSLAVACAAAFAIVLSVASCTKKPEDKPVLLDQGHLMGKLLDSAMVLRALDNYDHMIAVLQKAKAAAVYDPAGRFIDEYYDYIDQAAFQTGNFDVAVDAMMLRLHVQRNDLQKHQLSLSLAHALKKVGDTVKAIHWYREPVSSPVPSVAADARRNLAWLYIATELYDSTLHHMTYVETVVDKDNYEYDAARAWNSLIKARAYASLDSQRQAIRELNTGLLLYEQTPDYQLGEPSVRISICEGLLADSLRFIRSGIRWAPFRKRLQSIVSAAQKLATTKKLPIQSRTDLGPLLRRLLPLREADRFTDPLSIDQTPYFTDAITDDRSWQWASSLLGTFVRAGARVLPVAGLQREARAYRSLEVRNGHLIQEAYDGSRSNVHLDSIIWQNPDSTAWLTTVFHDWNILPWHGPRATAVVPVNDTNDSLWFFFSNQLGKGTTTALPRTLTTLHTTDGRLWTDTIYHAVRLSDTSVIAATSRGIWQVNPSTGRMHQVILEPSGINASTINTVSLQGDSVLITREYEGAHWHRILSSNPLQCAHGVFMHHLMVGSQQLWSPLQIDLNNPIPLTTVQIPCRNLLHDAMKPVMYRHYDPLLTSGGTVALLFPNSLLIHDATTGSVLVPIPSRILGRDFLTQLQYIHNSGSVGITTSNGLIVGTFLGQRRQAGATMVAHKTPSSSAFTLGSDGAAIRLSDLERSVQMVISRPSTYGSVAVPLLIHLPWNDSTISASTGMEVTINNIPAGDHRVIVRADDQPVDVPIMISVEPTLAEATWFRVLSLATLVTLFVVGTQYVRLSRTRLREQQQRELLEERVAIGRDLHDAVGAGLVRINMLAKTIHDEPVTTEIQRAVREANRNLRDVIWSVADVQSIDAAVAILAERVHAAAEEARIQSVIDVPAELPSWYVEPQVLRDMMLIITEALTNAIKHSGASLLEYSVALRADGLEILLKDNGVGFEIQSPKTGLGAGIGVESMRSRARRSGLDLSLSSTTTTGTSVHILLPSTFNASHRHR